MDDPVYALGLAGSAAGPYTAARGGGDEVLIDHAVAVVVDPVANLWGTAGSTVAERGAVAADVGTTIPVLRTRLITPTAGGRLAAALAGTFAPERRAAVIDRAVTVVIQVIAADFGAG